MCSFNFQTQLHECSSAITAILPDYLQPVALTFPSPDSTVILDTKDNTSSSFMDAEESTASSPDLICKEVLSTSDKDDSGESSHTFCLTAGSSSDEDDCNSVSPKSNNVDKCSRSSSPLSAVDIFTDFNTNVLKAVFDQADQDPSYNRIMVS